MLLLLLARRLALTTVLLSLAACAATSDDALTAPARVPLAGEICPTCGQPPAGPTTSPPEPIEWDGTIPGSEPLPIVFIPGRAPGASAGPPVELPEDEALEKARVDGAYRELLRKIHAPADYLAYGDFCDYGHWEGTSWAGCDDLPPGEWVYVYPHWYIWESRSDAAVNDR